MKIIFLFLALFQSYFNANFKDNAFIKFEYTGDIDKPIPEVIFFVSHADLDRSVFSDAFRISKPEFDSLSFEIKKNHKLFMKNEVNFYRITIYIDKTTEYFFINDKQNLANAFKEIEYQLRFSRKKNQIKDELSKILKRF